MATISTTTSISLSLSLSLSKLNNPKPHHHHHHHHHHRRHSLAPKTSTLNFHGTTRRSNNHTWSISAVTTDQVLQPDTTNAPLENAQQQIVETVGSATGDSGEATIIQILLITAFAALSLLTIGVIYIGVTDFLQKREKDKFEKEEATKKKKSKKKVRSRARSGPRGFGQKLDVDDDDDDNS
ncbi:hypothetical protein ACFE04_014875 [Oxalis oulophora]